MSITHRRPSLPSRAPLSMGLTGCPAPPSWHRFCQPLACDTVMTCRGTVPSSARGVRALGATRARLALEEGQMGVETPEDLRNKPISSPNSQDAVKIGNTGKEQCAPPFCR